MSGKAAFKFLFSKQFKSVYAHAITTGHINSAVRLNYQAMFLIRIGVFFLELRNKLVDCVPVVHINGSDFMSVVFRTIGVTHNSSLPFYFITAGRICQAHLRLFKLPLSSGDRPGLACKPAVIAGDVSPLVLRVAVRSLCEILVDIFLPPELNARSGEAVLVPSSVGDTAAVYLLSHGALCTSAPHR